MRTYLHCLANGWPRHPGRHAQLPPGRVHADWPRSLVGVLLSFILIASSLLACRPEPARPEGTPDPPQRVVLDNHMTMAAYAGDLDFDSTAGEGYLVFIKYRFGKAEAVVLAHTEPEPGSYADTTIVCWPSERTSVIVGRMNEVVEGRSIDLAPYSLTYPISLEDAVDNWEDVLDLFLYGFDADDRCFILYG